MPFPLSLPPFTLHPIPDFLYLVPDFMTVGRLGGNATQAQPPDGYLTALAVRLDAPLLGAIAHASSPHEAARCLDLALLGV